ncbi:SICAvar, type I [Plasmodium knowlesi strain H]|uniref:SICAvar, type I n=3 Tax=Plasmodium knowlesi TaxID=5850 RepID=A0A5K1VNG5_PLAKH|nr:SICAvar, type I [Plasmodium knowlesi strain H]OTN66694.1 SICAvar type I [Plasmodium knowlesi]CAA9986721.1 SICAvar, type I [Plasmodium knowlesi strain H]SBO23539.1 SICAvar, type I [Plasmodium knowlesi strain H]SBO25053.1 SICAvar, type I [Plasmodium knowlesi strain H]VVS76195.1 SICAvar, type I [Plasmodium knowlesi strain H]|eukprot:XP_002257906.1 SICA antigen [Plasmodium knowlesi strain H]
MTTSSSGNDMLKAWLGTTLNSSGGAGGGTPGSGKEAMEKLEKNLEAALEDLEKWLTRQESLEVSHHCQDAGSFVQGEDSGKKQYAKEMCKGIVEIKYFVSGVNKRRKAQTLDYDAQVTELTDAQAYARCIVGTLALSELYGDNCHLGTVIGAVSSKVEAKLQTYAGDGAKLDKCKNIDPLALVFAKSLLQNKIKQWAEKERTTQKGRSWRVWIPWDYWGYVCKKQKSNREVLQQERENNASSMAQFVQLPEDKKNAPGSVPMSEILINDKYKLDTNTIENALNNIIKDGKVETTNISTDDLCKRLQCIEEYLKKQTTTTPGSTAGTAVQPSATDEFWGETGDVYRLWNELAGAMKKINGKAKEGNGNGCETLDSPSDKAACNYLHAGFTELYNPKNTTPAGGAADLLKNNPSFRQTMGCFLLHSYAKHIKEKAICDIKEGIEKAFQLGESLSKSGANCSDANGKGPCVPCQWTDASMDSCTVRTGTTGSAETAKTKVEEMVRGKEPDTKPIIDNINTMFTLCEHMKCIASRVNSSTNKDDFWKEKIGEVGRLWTELSTAMKRNGGNDESGNGDCSQMDDGREPTDSEKKACNYLHAGFIKLKSIATSESTEYQTLSRNPLFVQTMGCFLLHSYAKKMKSEAKCEIAAGIKKAFKLGDDLIKQGANCNGSSSGKGQCIPCQWNENILDSCEIKTNGSASGTGQNDKVENKLKGIVNGSDDQIKEMLKNINEMTTLCDHMKCIATHLNSPSGQKQKADDFWKEETGEVVQLWQKLSEAMAQSGGQDSGDHCNTVDDNGSATGATGRTPTTPEKKACNYLHAGITKLKDLSKPAASNAKDNKILSKDPSFVQAMGCILLKEYAKKMQGKSTCVIDAGIREAFKSWSPNNKTDCTDSNPCIECKLDHKDYGDCKINTTDTSGGSTTPTKVTDKLTYVKDKIDNTSNTTLTKINEMKNLCDYIRCAAPKWFKHYTTTQNDITTANKSWCDFWDKTVKVELQNMFTIIQTNGNNTATKNNDVCNKFGDDNPDSVERKACNHIAAGLKYINTITGSTTTQKGHTDDDKFLKQTMMCAALNLYATKIKERSQEKCPIDETKIGEMFTKWNEKNNNNSSSSSPCNGVGGNNNCFVCDRVEISEFKNCQLSVDSALVGNNQGATCNKDKTYVVKVETQMNELLNDGTIKMEEKLSNINEMNNFCSVLQCTAKKWNLTKNQNANPTWNNIEDDAKGVLAQLLSYMTESNNQRDAAEYCNDDNKWSKFGHKGKHTNKAACLLFAAGLKHIYVRGRDSVKGPSFEQTMGCLFLKEYAKQLKDLANKKKRGNSWVHPLCDIDKGIKHAFNESEKIMKSVLTQCNNGPNGISCFVCTQNENDYKDCSIGSEKVQNKVEPLFTDPTKQTEMEETLSNTVCPILITDLLTPFLPLAPVSIGLSAMAYYLWKYFGPLGKGGPRFRRSPTEIPGPSVQEQVLDHADEAASHEYRLVKERKPRSAPTRTKRSGRVNRRTIIEIHFEVLDECQKGDTQLTQKDFLELLVQEFMGSELMEEEQVPKEEVLMEGVPMESVPMERVPILGSVFMV